MKKDPVLPRRLRLILQDIVRAQDEGYAFFEEMEKARFGFSFIHALSAEADLERARMHHAGQDVYNRPSEGNFALGLDEYKYKTCAHNWEWDRMMSEKEDKEVHICHRCGSRRRVDLKAEESTESE